MDEDWRRCKLSVNFSATDLMEAGKTWAAVRIENKPAQESTWGALRLLCEKILEPIRGQFGSLEITYGFSSDALRLEIKRAARKEGADSGISPADDQHAGHELNRNGDPICRHLGQAADFFVPGVSSAEVALWVAEQLLPFDSLYFYGEEKPLHVSVGPKNRRSMLALLPTENSKRGPPRRITEAWLTERLVV